MTRSLTIAAALAVTSVGIPAQADFIVDPSSSGLSAVNITGIPRDPTTGIYALSGPVLDATGRQLQIGAGTVPGGLASLTLNNQLGTYDVIGITGLGLTYVGASGSAGALTVDGAGAFIETDTTWFGFQNDATIEILNGGRFSGETVFVGLDNFDGTPPGTTNVTVDGAGSTLETATVSIGASSSPTTTSSTVIVSNGGLLSAAPTPGEQYSYGQIYVGSDSQTQDDSLTITGAGSRAEATNFVGVISLTGSDRIDVLDGGALYSGGGITVAGFEQTGELLVSGTGSSASTDGDIAIGLTRFVGFDDPVNYTGPNYGLHDGRITVEDNATMSATGNVIVDNPAQFDTSGGTVVGDPVAAELVVRSGATVSAAQVIVNSGGTLTGDGGIIDADVVVNGGTLAPGASPGVMTIDGDLDLNGATVEIEIGGTATGDYDQIFVSGNLVSDAATTFYFSLFGGYIPEAGDEFAFFDVGGNIDLGLATFDFSGFGAGYASRVVNGGGGGYALRFDSVPASAEVPLPAAGLLLLSGIGVLGAGLRRKRV